jgi:hypothetical protein
MSLRKRARRQGSEKVRKRGAVEKTKKVIEQERVSEKSWEMRKARERKVGG